MKFKFVPKWSGMVLYVKYKVPDSIPGLWIDKWRKATDAEAYQVMCLINKNIKET